MLLAAALVALPACEKPADKKEDPAKEKKAASGETNGGETNAGETNAGGEEADATPEKATVVPNPDGGQWVKSPTYGVEFLAPDEWEIKLEEDGISATDSDESTTVVLVGSKSQGMIQDALNNVKRKVEFKDAKLQDTKDDVINGLPAQTVRGTAVLVNEVPVAPEDGSKPDPENPKTEKMDQEIQFIAYNVQVGKGGVTMMIFSQAEMYEAKRETIEGIAKTLKRLK
jgi:hypothetical protein